MSDVGHCAGRAAGQEEARSRRPVRIVLTQDASGGVEGEGRRRVAGQPLECGVIAYDRPTSACNEARTLSGSIGETPAVMRAWNCSVEFSRG